MYNRVELTSSVRSTPGRGLFTKDAGNSMEEEEEDGRSVLFSSIDSEVIARNSITSQTNQQSIEINIFIIVHDEDTREKHIDEMCVIVCMYVFVCVCMGKLWFLNKVPSPYMIYIYMYRLK